MNATLEASSNVADKPQRKSQAFIDALREFADFVERHDLDYAQYQLKSTYFLPLNKCFSTKEDLIASTKGMGFLSKVAEGTHFSLRKQIGPFMIDFFIDRELVCEAIPVKKILPAEPARPATEALPEREVTVIEWKCPESLLG